jgi:hypothetical protein
LDWAVAFGFGLFGGAIVQYRDVMAIAKLPADRRGAWVTSLFYWGTLAVYAVIGGVFALAFSLSGFEVRPLLAINVGAAWPLLLGRGAKAIPIDGRID